MSITATIDQAISAWYESLTEETLRDLQDRHGADTPRQAWEAFKADCLPPATNATGESLAAPAPGGQGVGTINVDDLVHCALSEVFGKLHEDSGFSIAAANKAIYQSLDRLGYLERGK